MVRRTVILFLAAFAGWLLPFPASGTPQVPPGIQLDLPIPGRTTTAFKVGEYNWLPGHRGVDLEGYPGQPVRAAAAGRVRFAGRVADRSVVSVEHGDLRTTYEPITPSVPVGQWVQPGQVIGYLAAGHPGCSAAACLHWGLTDGNKYFDPTASLRSAAGNGGQLTRLLPTDIKRDYPTPVDPGPQRPHHGSGSSLLWPANGVPGSPFGMRKHPILGYYRMHWGTDIGASCGSPLYAAADGWVIHRSSNSGHGNHLVIDIGTMKGKHLEVGYSHATSYVVGVGQQVRRGQVVGYVGSTGLSTGCHLHLELSVNGTKVDPTTWF